MTTISKKYAYGGFSDDPSALVEADGLVPLGNKPSHGSDKLVPHLCCNAAHGFSGHNELTHFPVGNFRKFQISKFQANFDNNLYR